MHRHGHIGIALLCLSPIVAVLVSINRWPLAIAFSVGVLLIEPLPDFDYSIPGLRHRGYSHTILAAVLIGGVLGGVGFALGTVSSQFHSVPPLELAAFGGAVGTAGIVIHLIGDALTVGGIRPYRPVSRTQVSITSIRARNLWLNEGLLLAGSAAMGGGIWWGVVGW